MIHALSQRYVLKKAIRSGFTLIEMLIVLTLLAAISGMVAFSLGMIGRSDIRGEALKFSSQIRYVFNQSATQNQSFQLVIDLNAQTYHVEVLSIEGALSRDQITGDDINKQLQERADKRASRLDDEDTDFAGALTRDPVDQYLIEPTELPDNVAFLGVHTSHHDDMQTEGIATINFFPSGFVEPSLIYIGERPEEGKAARDSLTFSLMIHPLTGHTDVEAGRAEVEESFFAPEDED